MNEVSSDPSVFRDVDDVVDEFEYVITAKENELAAAEQRCRATQSLLSDEYRARIEAESSIADLQRRIQGYEREAAAEKKQARAANRQLDVAHELIAQVHIRLLSVLEQRGANGFRTPRHGSSRLEESAPSSSPLPPLDDVMTMVVNRFFQCQVSLLEAHRVAVSVVLNSAAYHRGRLVDDERIRRMEILSDLENAGRTMIMNAYSTGVSSIVARLVQIQHPCARDDAAVLAVHASLETLRLGESRRGLAHHLLIALRRGDDFEERLEITNAVAKRALQELFTSQVAAARAAKEGIFAESRSECQSFCHAEALNNCRKRNAELSQQVSNLSVKLSASRSTMQSISHRKAPTAHVSNATVASGIASAPASSSINDANAELSRVKDALLVERGKRKAEQAARDELQRELEALASKMTTITAKAAEIHAAWSAAEVRAARAEGLVQYANVGVQNADDDREAAIDEDHADVDALQGCVDTVAQLRRAVQSAAK